MPRRDLTLSEKIALLDKIKALTPTASCRQLGILTGVPRSTISRVIADEVRLREEWNSNKVQAKTRKRKREGKDPDVEEALKEWFLIIRGRGVQVNGPMLKAKAEELARKLGHTNFRATDGWLSRWKIRHEIKFKKAQSEQSNSGASTAEDWELAKLIEFLKTFNPDDIYCADETALFYRATPDGSLSYNHETLSRSNKAMDHITMLCCCNMSGCDKRKLLVVGKYSKPGCFRGLNMDSLPVEYYADKNASMTCNIFQSWLMNWDAELQRIPRKILLLVDKCPAHPRVGFLMNIHLAYLPGDKMTILQPLRMGIIHNLKEYYRGKLVQHIIGGIEEGIYSPSTKAEEISSKISLLLSVQFLSDSWRRVSCSLIQNCFAYSGFRTMEPDISDLTEATNKMTCELFNVKNHEQFLYIDDDLPCYGEGTSGIEGNIEQLLEDQESDGDDAPDLDLITRQEARKCIFKLRKFFMQEGNEGSPMSALDACAEFISLQDLKKIRQDSFPGLIQN